MQTSIDAAHEEIRDNPQPRTRPISGELGGLVTDDWPDRVPITEQVRYREGPDELQTRSKSDDVRG
jgi:hypothetical protein